MWSIDTTHASTAAFGRYRKKHPAEYAAVFGNLGRVLGFLAGGQRIGGFQVSFLRSEGGDVYRIGQTGVKSAHETRLYVHFSERESVAYVLEVGDKDSQPRDIKAARAKADMLRTQGG
jgi:hypothetical protein